MLFRSLNRVEVVRQIQSPMFVGCDRGSRHRDIVVLVVVDVATGVLTLLEYEVAPQHQPGARRIRNIAGYVEERRGIGAVDPIVGAADLRIHVSVQPILVSIPGTDDRGIPVDGRGRISERRNDPDKGATAIGV